ncbi:MAG: histidine triad nucleotide-binding protein [Opitutales bacterium]|nr:histidine triad nucleotide-binding protein [Opitutales bacterium]
MEKTIFQKIIDREIFASIVYEDDRCIAFHDVSPQAPVHCLIVPKILIPRLSETTMEQENLLGHLLTVANIVADLKGIRQSGFRIVINCGKDGGESIPHLHVHMLGGRSLQWPPG